MSDLTPTEESLGRETSDDPQQASTDAVKAPKKRRLRIAIAAGVALLLLVALLAVTLGRDSGRSVTLVLVDKTSENPLPPDFTVAIANDAPQYPKMDGKRADLVLGRVGSAGKPLAITFKAPRKSVVKFIFPKKLPSGDLVIVASLGDSAVTAQLAASRAEAPRKNPASEERKFAVSQWHLIESAAAPAEEQYALANRNYYAIWGSKELAPLTAIASGIRDGVLPPLKLYSTALSQLGTESPLAKVWLDAKIAWANSLTDLRQAEYSQAITRGRYGEAEVTAAGGRRLEAEKTLEAARQRLQDASDKEGL